MALGSTAIQLPSVMQPPPPIRDIPPLRGLLVTGDTALARAFQRELKRSGCSVSLDVYGSLEEATSRANPHYGWITIDLDGALAPLDAVRSARCSWPGALVAIVSYWWSEDERVAHAEADYVVHKPVRATELEALFAACRAPNGAGTASGLLNGLRPVS